MFKTILTKKEADDKLFAYFECYLRGECTFKEYVRLVSDCEAIWPEKYFAYVNVVRKIKNSILANL